ncbi:UNKNOWN [Stylonychia lemnae]|uniref:Uncharacterized protein n=1 Tax=Stylonychia lemnae TaxID=5949 RepID=A0A078AV34_STYLE|nr:UNKNOWN [Stylonychia lemnae]|eukprot:CDW84723.1 UNKNOWN [Stylonychia lemnae]
MESTSKQTSSLIQYSKQNFYITFTLRLIEEKKTSQELIIKLLERKGLYRIYQLMSAVDPSNFKIQLTPSIVMRRLAAKMLIELSFRNEKTQVMLCESFSFTPIKGQVALNPIPQSIQHKLQKDPSILNHIKNCYASISSSEQTKQIEETQHFSQKYWSYPDFQSQKSNNIGINFYKNQNHSLDAISSAGEEDESNYNSRVHEQKVQEDDRGDYYAKLLKEYPDPFDYIIGFHCTSSQEQRRLAGQSPSALPVYSNSKPKQESPKQNDNKHFMSTSLPSNRADKRPKTSENNYTLNYGGNKYQTNQNNGRNTAMNGSHQNGQSEHSNPFVNSLKVPSDSNDQGYIKYNQLTSSSVNENDSDYRKENQENPSGLQSKITTNNNGNGSTTTSMEQIPHQYQSNSTWNPRDLKKEENHQQVITNNTAKLNLNGTGNAYQHKKNDSVIVSHKHYQQASPSIQSIAKIAYQSARKGQFGNQNQPGNYIDLIKFLESTMLSPSIMSMNQSKQVQPSFPDNALFNKSLASMSWEKQQKDQSLYQSISKISSNYYNQGQSSSKKDKISYTNRIKSPSNQSVGKNSQSSSIGRSSVEKKFQPSSISTFQQSKLQTAVHSKKTSNGLGNTLTYSTYKENNNNLRDNSQNQRTGIYQTNQKDANIAQSQYVPTHLRQLDENLNEHQPGQYKPNSTYVDYNPPSRSNKQSISIQMDIQSNAKKVANKTQVQNYISGYSYDSQDIDAQYQSFNPNANQNAQMSFYNQFGQTTDSNQQNYSSVERSANLTHDSRFQGTTEKMDNLRRLSDSIKKKIQEQEYVNQQAKEKMKVKSIHLQSQVPSSNSTYVANTMTNNSSSVGSSTRTSQTRQNNQTTNSSVTGLINQHQYQHQNSNNNNNQSNTKDLNTYFYSQKTQVPTNRPSAPSSNSQHTINNLRQGSTSPMNNKFIQSTYITASQSNQQQQQYHNKSNSLMSMISNQLSQKLNHQDKYMFKSLHA